MRLTIVKDGIFALSKLAFLQDSLIQFLQVVLSESIVFQEFLDFIVNILGKVCALVTILDLELVDQKAL